MFAAWHPYHGFGPVNEIAIREQYDHAKTDVKLLSHTGDKLWKVVPVELKIAGQDQSSVGASVQQPLRRRPGLQVAERLQRYG